MPHPSVRRKEILTLIGLVVGAIALVFTFGRALSTWAAADGNLAPDPTSECFLFRIEIDPASGNTTREPVQLTPQSITRRDPPSVSPNGKWIAYWQGGAAKHGLAVMSAGGGTPRIVTTRRGHGQIMWLGPEELVFQETSDDTAEPTTLAKVNLKTGAIAPLLRADIGTGGFDWQWVPARNEIVFLTRDATPKGRVFKAHSLATGQVREIATIDRLTNFRHTFRVSPDGLSIAYGVWVSLPGGGRAAELRATAIDGTGEKVLLAAPSQAQERWRPSGFPYAWSPNGKFILYDQFPGGISVLELATGKTWPVPGAQDTAFYEWGLATWSPDGTFLVINRYRIR